MTQNPFDKASRYAVKLDPSAFLAWATGLLSLRAVGREEIWEKALEGWNVIESTVVNKWIAEGSAKGRAEGRTEEAVALVIAVLEAKFGNVPPEVEAAIRGCSDLAQLQTWVTQAAKTAVFDEFRATTGL